ncbi:MAG: TFIIB-type zinc ribbon-containing protein [Deltaproteobacteria bacterium]
MECPECSSVALVMADRQGVEIDYCPQCRGVWLDRGELDKIIERSASFAESKPKSAPTREDSRPYERRGDHDDDYDRDGRRRKKKGFLGELFDFD